MENSVLEVGGRQEPFSISYISAIATAAGYGVSLNTSLNPDRKSIDLSIEQFGRPIIDVLRIQAKCTFHYLPKDNYLPFQIKKKNYEDIRLSKKPHILVVLNVPKECGEWVFFNENSMELKYNCYWYSLKGLDELKKDSTVLRIPLENKLDILQLSRMMKLLYEGNFLSYDNKVIEV